MNWFYLALNVLSISVPLAFSFGPKIKFYQNFRFLFPALLITASFFIVWDFWFTAEDIWKFNPEYVLGIDIVNLPFEEWIFFIFIPYSCMFIHESLKFFIPNTFSERTGKTIALTLSILLVILSIFFYDRLYTSVTFIFLAIFLLLSIYVLKSWFLGRFFLTYLVTLIPFSVVNGFLTSMPVLIYNDSENSQFRAGTIPIEDFFYSMLMILMNVTIYEFLKRRNLAKK